MRAYTVRGGVPALQARRLAMSFTFGCNTLYPWGRLPAGARAFDLAAHREALRLIREAGLDGAEFSHYQHLGPADQEKARELCDCLGLVPWSAHAWAPLPAEPVQEAAALADLRAGIEGAARLGVRVLVVHATGCPVDAYGRRAEVLERVLGALSPRAAAAGVTLAVENCASREDLEFLAQTLDRLDLAAVGFNIDTGHAVLHGMKPEEAIRIMGRRLVTTHLQDNFGQRDDHLPPGRGAIAWEPVREALLGVGYGGMLMVEISDGPPGREPDARTDTRDAADFLHRLFGVPSPGR
jgi:sugar phosphate isomerase/epimerase